MGMAPLTRRVWEGSAPTRTRARLAAGLGCPAPALGPPKPRTQPLQGGRHAAARRVAGALTKEIPACQFRPRVSCVETRCVQSRRCEDRNCVFLTVTVSAKLEWTATRSARAVDPLVGSDASVAVRAGLISRQILPNHRAPQ